MSAYYTFSYPLRLSEDDKRGIQYLYGVNPQLLPPTPPPPPPPPPPETNEIVTTVSHANAPIPKVCSALAKVIRRMILILGFVPRMRSHFFWMNLFRYFHSIILCSHYYHWTMGQSTHTCWLSLHFYITGTLCHVAKCHDTSQQK